MENRSEKLVLVTGATGKVGQHFIGRFLANPAWDGARLRALCHNRQLTAGKRLEVVRGSMAERSDVARAVEGVTHVLHLATCKETPDDVIDVTVRGLFWLLEECRQSPAFERFVLIGGDAGVGHFVYPHPIPVTETQKHSAYAGCYALSKVLEEAMLEQYYIQYDLDGCCLRAPWIMEKDDFRHSLSFGEDVFGGPRWRDLVDPEKAEAYRAAGTVPMMLDPQGRPVLRNFVHADDLVTAIVTALDHPGGPPAALQHLHGRAGRLPRGGALSAGNAWAAERRDPDRIPWHVAGQQQGKVPARLAAALRPATADRGGVELSPRRRRTAQDLVSRMTRSATHNDGR